MKEREAQVLACDAWAVDWATDSPVISSAKPVRVVEYNRDGEFRHLGYTAPLTARSRTAERALTTLTRRAAKVFATKPNLRDCGGSIVTSVLVSKPYTTSPSVRRCGGSRVPMRKQRVCYFEYFEYYCQKGREGAPCRLRRRRLQPARKLRVRLLIGLDHERLLLHPPTRIRADRMQSKAFVSKV